VSTHNYEIRYWMASAGIDPDKDVRLVVIPPPQMVANLTANNIVGYCVGEPWNQRAVEMGIGHSLITNYEIWNNNPEKVFGVNRDWADKHPNSHKAAVRALIEAGQWADKPENRKEVVRIISQKSYVNAPPSVVDNSMTGTWMYSKAEGPQKMPDFNVFHRYAATFPWRSHAIWFLTQMARWGQLEKAVNFKQVAEAVYLPDVFREAAKEVGVAYPTLDYKSEGSHAGGWTLDKASSPIAMGPDQFFDGMAFDPAKPIDYLKGFPVHSMKVPMEAWLKANS
jgi:nitrate/nitrite transport system substrate-binding protein